jgi:hypothetical protein
VVANPAGLGGGQATFPELPRLVLERFPLRAASWTIWPDRPQTPAQYAIGHPLELRPFTWDYLEASCDESVLRLWPHYDQSSWDTFFVDRKRVVTVHALGGAFRHTFGKQPQLLAGVCAVLRAMQAAVVDPGLQGDLAAVASFLCGPDLGDGPVAPPPEQQMRGLKRRFWAWKLGARRLPPRLDAR